MQAIRNTICTAVALCLWGVVGTLPVQAAERHAPAGPPANLTPIATDRIIVRLQRPAHDRAERHRDRRLAKRDFDALPFLGGATRAEARRWNARRIRPLYTEEFAHPELARKYGLDRVYVVEVPPGTDARAMAAAFAKRTDDIERAGVDVIGGVAGFLPNDPGFSFQWGLRNFGQTVGRCSGGSNSDQACHTDANCPSGSCVNKTVGTPDADIDASEAWEIHTGIGGDVTVAIIDSGVNPHPDFGTRLLPGRNTDPFESNPNNTADDCGHGTHVAGIVGAGGHNGLGVAGVNWGVNLLPVRVLGHNQLGQIHPCGGPLSALANGIVWAADNGADVANMSLQYNGLNLAEEAELRSAVQYAADVGMLMFAATGNNGQGGSVSNIAYPARLHNVVAVGGTNSRDERAAGSPNSMFTSHYGPQMDLSAPGDRVHSTWVNNDYRITWGTSMATPHAAGLASLLKSFVPELTPRDIFDLMLITTRDLGDPGWDEEYGYGRINAFDALTAAGEWPVILGSVPGNHSIDARQATDSLAFFNFGWDAVDMDLSADRVAGATADAFRIIQRDADPSSMPEILDALPNDADSLTVYLDRRIPLFKWTTVVYDNTAAVTVGFLPGDVNADRVTNESDVLALRDALAAMDAEEPVEPPLPFWSTDLNRSGQTTPLDLLTCVDLLNGADAYPKFLGKTLP